MILQKSKSLLRDEDCLIKFQNILKKADKQWISNVITSIQISCLFFILENLQFQFSSNIQLLSIKKKRTIEKSRFIQIMQEALTKYLNEQLQTKKLCTIQNLKQAFPKITIKQTRDFLLEFYEKHSNGLKMLCYVTIQQQDKLIIKKTFYDRLQKDFEKNPINLKDFKIVVIYNNSLQLKQVEPFLKRKNRVVEKIQKHALKQQNKSKPKLIKQQPLPKQELVHLPKVHPKKPLHNDKNFFNTKPKQQPKQQQLKVTNVSSDQQYEPQKFKQTHFEREKCLTPSQKKLSTDNMPATAGDPMQIQEDSQDKYLQQLEEKRIAAIKLKEKKQADQDKKLVQSKLDMFFGKKKSN